MNPVFSDLLGFKPLKYLVLIGLFLMGPQASLTLAQVPREPDYEAMKNADQNSQNKQAVDRLKDERENKFRGGAQNFSEVKENMTRLQKPILLGQGGNVDQWYSPHLRDILMDPGERNEIIRFRSWAGGRVVDWIGCFLCVNGIGMLGGPTACSECQPENGGCWWQKWFDSHTTPTCCGKFTGAYAIRRTDSNFKACCVRNEDRQESTEEIACRHPDGSGWAGLFEYYYPTAIIGWENSRTTTMIADKDEVKQCLEQSKPLMHGGKASSWVEGAIKKNLEVIDKIGGSSGSKSGAADLNKKVQDSLQVADSIQERDQFTDSLAGEGLTMRVNFPAMDPDYRRRLARHFCMREDQFMKLMDEREDKLQKGGGKTLEELRDSNRIPIWANYCKQGVTLMTDPGETSKCRNVDATDTNFVQGMAAWDKDPLFCQRMNLTNPRMQEYFGQTLAKNPGPRLSEAAVGYTCRDGGKLNGSMVPVELYRHSPVERRAAISDHVLGFLIAGGLYSPSMIEGKKSYYKRFEPRPYSSKFGMFSGKPFYGSGGGPVNEVDMPCVGLQPKNYEGLNKSDQLFISDQTHPKRAFTGETELIHESSPKEFNRYVGEWGKGGQNKSMPNRAVDDGSDDLSSNYGVAFRIFATCPSQYTRWHPLDLHDALIQARCGDENFGGNMEGVPTTP